MKLIIFERTNFEISETNRYSFSIETIGNSQKAFDRYIDFLLSRSENFKTYINVYRIYKDNSVVKIAWIKTGELYTL